MTNKDRAQALWATVMDRTRSNLEHRTALDELQALKKTAKTSLDKLGVPQVMWDREDKSNRQHAEMAAHLEEDPKTDEAAADPLEEEVLIVAGQEMTRTEELALDKAKHRPCVDPLEEKPKPARKPGDERGLISERVRHLLSTTDLPYHAIVMDVIGRFPKAQTTSRSVASVASDMRRAGKKVSERRTKASA